MEVIIVLAMEAHTSALQNATLLQACLSALQSPAVSRLSHTWRVVWSLYFLRLFLNATVYFGLVLQVSPKLWQQYRGLCEHKNVDFRMDSTAGSSPSPVFPPPRGCREKT